MVAYGVLQRLGLRGKTVTVRQPTANKRRKLMWPCTSLLPLCLGVQHRLWQPGHRGTGTVPGRAGRRTALLVLVRSWEPFEMVCVCFVSWCATECGYIEAGIIPRFSVCSDDVDWFVAQGQWQPNTYGPIAGDILGCQWHH